MTLWLYDFMHNQEYVDIRKWQMAPNQLSYSLYRGVWRA